MGAGSGGWGWYGACNLQYLVPPGPLGVTRTLNRVRLGKNLTLALIEAIGRRWEALAAPGILAPGILF